MSWLSIPLPNPFKSLQFSDDDEPHPQSHDSSSPPSQNNTGGGVKDDFSAIGESIGRQLRGVASFLAPPPLSSAGAGGDVSPSSSSSSAQTFAGIRSDLAEIGGTFKNSLSLLSSHKAVTGFSKLASNFLQFDEDSNDVEVVNRRNDVDDDRVNTNDNDEVEDEDDDEDEGVVGITDEVIEFANQISGRPELWTDFPLSLNSEFDMSDAQAEHSSAIEQYVSSLADLRSRLSSEMSEKQFWMIYFILLLPRLNEDDMELLSTPEIVEARETLLMMLRTNKNTEIQSENPQSDGSSKFDIKVNEADVEDSEPVEKGIVSENPNASRSIESNEFDNSTKLIKEDDGNRLNATNDHNQSDDKADATESSRILSSKETAVADNSNVRSVHEEHEHVGNWLQEPVTTGTSASAPKQFHSEDDVSFSDLEDDDNDLPNRPSGSGPAPSTRTSSPEGSNEWVRLNKNVESKGNQLRGQSSSRDKDSEGEESSDWLTVDDFDP